MVDLKQVILVRMDLKMPTGKLAAQVAHASVGAMIESSKFKVMKWRAQGGKKVVLKAASEKDLLKFEELARQERLKVSLITDAGHTVLEPGTVTCLGIGPDEEEKIDKVTGELEPL